MRISVNKNEEWFPVFVLEEEESWFDKEEVSEELVERYKKAVDEFVAVQKELGNDCIWL